MCLDLDPEYNDLQKTLHLSTDANHKHALASRVIKLIYTNQDGLSSKK